TCGLGGDSEIAFYPKVRFGPRRVVPLSLLSLEYPKIIKNLQEQIDSENYTCTIFLIANRDTTPIRKLSHHEAQIWDALQSGPPQLLSSIVPANNSMQPLHRLVDAGLVRISDFTPTDAQHVLGKQNTGNRPAAVAAAAILAHFFGYASAKSLCNAVNQHFVRQLARVTFQHANLLVGNTFALSEELLDTLQEGGKTPVRLTPSLDMPIAVVGGPAKLYARRLGMVLDTKAPIVPFGHVANAIGAVSGLLEMQAFATIISPSAGIYRVTAQNVARKDFAQEKQARAYASNAIDCAARSLIPDVDPADIAVALDIDRRVAHHHDGSEIFIETTMVATATRKI
ncbi:MAG: hypothetical protein AAF352_06425, partial [Pseudomonadota bacterium]